MSARTQAFNEEFNGHPVLAIWEVDHQGQKKGRSPVISFGIRKAEAIQRHQEDLQAFLQAQNETPAVKSTTASEAAKIAFDQTWLGQTQKKKSVSEPKKLVLTRRTAQS